MPLTVTVTGASGFVGSHLCEALVEAGHHGARHDPPPRHVRGGRRARLRRRLRRRQPRVRRSTARTPPTTWCTPSTARTSSPPTPTRPATSARRPRRPASGASSTSAAWAARTSDLSAHLRSRREVEHLLGGDGVPVTVLRAAIVVGHGGISWEITRQLVDHLPAMVVPLLDEHPDPADRARRRRRVPGRGARAGRGRGPRVRDRRARRPHLRADDAAGVAGDQEPAAADARGPAAHAAAVVALAGLRHRRRHRDRPQPDRLDEQRGRGARRRDQAGRAPAAAGLRRRRPGRHGRARARPRRRVAPTDRRR